MTYRDTMTYRRHTANMSFDPEDKVFVGRVTGIDDVITFHGESVPEFEANFHMVVDDYIGACERLGSPPEKPANGNTSVRPANSASPRKV